MAGTQTAPDSFRLLSQLFEPDPRQTYYRVCEEKGARPKVLDDHYAEAERLTLNPSVPGTIAAQFNTARELLVFSWFT